MWYLLKVDALAAAVIFAGAGLVILVLFAWQEAKALVAARHGIYKRLSKFATQPQLFANPLAISRSASLSERSQTDRFAKISMI